ncbi:MAG TPA: hypothetical protein VFX60_09535, partial [Micromonospora sp.]|nr:hypothetical protein [Micromonospora sp.]
MTARKRRRFPLAVALIAALAMLSGVVVNPGTAQATPDTSNPGDEGETPLLRDVLETSSRGYVEARQAVDRSRKRGLQLALQLKMVEERIERLRPEVNELAAVAYRSGRIGPMTVLLNSTSPDAFLERAESLEMMAMRDNKKLHELNEALDQATRAKAAIEATLAEEKKQLAIMDRQKKEAERALALAGGESTGGFVSATSPVAKPAPRNRDGSWPQQSCSQKDPTTSGCLTPRT